MNRLTLFALPFLTVLPVVTAFAQHNPLDNPSPPNNAITAPAAVNAQIVGKQGWITLNADTQFGAAVLKPGTYYLQHQANEASHAVAFQRVGDPDLALQYSDEGTVGSPITAQCKIQSLPARVKHTTIATVSDGPARRIARIEIKGENVAHVF